MSWLTAEEISGAREDLAELLDSTCTIRRRSAPGPGGVWETIGEDVPCRLGLIGSAVGEGIALAAADVNSNAVLALPAGTEVGDQTTVTGVLQAVVEGRRFEARLVVPRQAFLMRVLGSVEG